MTSWTVVVPTLGRSSLTDLLADLAAQLHRPDQVVLVNDGPDALAPVAVDLPITVRSSGGRGPAAARNVGWKTAGTEWVVFLDDDVRLPDSWSAKLLADLAAAGPEVAGVQAKIRVPDPQGRRPTDWERSTAGLRTAHWATADMAYRTLALHAVDGFDERFRRAYREDADLARRVRDDGWRLVRGERHIVHPVRPADFWISVRVQRGNADDALMRALHGRRWRARTECPPGRFPHHVATVCAAVLALSRYRRPGLALWLVLYAEFAIRRIAAGPRTPRETGRMAATSWLIPFAAVGHRIAGWWRFRGSQAWPEPVRAVLFDRDGTLVHDVPYNGDPEKVTPVDDAATAVERLRSAGLRVGVVTNQSAIGRGLATADQVCAVNDRIDHLVGPFDTWQVCPHTVEDGCGCRKPADGLIRSAARSLGVPPRQIVVIGDIAADLGAADAAGARSILVPNDRTRPEEILAARVTAPDLRTAVDQVLKGLR
ncbi:HAD-IIIA family hydrolase [Kribbella turkmenica]|uniref:D,D-heptose 1,7-bisphosphate phosphatase n=1 Tax=Kribbella turkmenica TaxID=2530375 RepID=A0A4R4X0P9_9ACTN|nr:HAD-IIIA family hydrolase [Kribbella turkmenica]TDD23754.1 HAD-IIIA family hydrolase [Kribbella turkmenica]